MPKWLDNAIFYEIYPQTFLDTFWILMGMVSEISRGSSGN